eukprot:TRINITY_DN19559_c0_g1_i1.p1 TRINITY_DN19559_c0_g1~~TRINITY_DN19559_c0_g1_i1.p1  ORF type:complete len:310 (-),score=48.89 TRINITY_DN19559_c0_g1_i1:229-1158(-)
MSVFPGGKVVFVGSIFRDVVAVSERFPKRGETIFGSEFFMGFGGKGANPCVMAARLGAQTSMVGRVGDDENGEAYIKHLEQCAVDIKNVKTVENTSSGVATIFVESSTGENEIIIVPGANAKLFPSDVQSAEDTIKGCSVLSTVLEISHNTALEALKLGRKHGLITILNAAPAVSNLDKELLENTDILILNETEAEIISGVTGDYRITSTKLQELGCTNIVVTLGAQGAVLIPKDAEPILIPVAKVEKVVDTTGAGDAFVGSVAYLLATQKSMPLKEVVKKACSLASYTVTRKGTQSSYPPRSQVLHLL